MSIRPDHRQFAAYSTRAALDKEAERLATLLAVAERDLARLLSILEWLDGDADLEPEDGCENDDAEPSLSAPERRPNCEANAIPQACSQIAWGAGGDADLEEAWL